MIPVSKPTHYCVPRHRVVAWGCAHQGRLSLPCVQSEVPTNTAASSSILYRSYPPPPTIICLPCCSNRKQTICHCSALSPPHSPQYGLADPSSPTEPSDPTRATADTHLWPRVQNSFPEDTCLTVRARSLKQRRRFQEPHTRLHTSRGGCTLTTAKAPAAPELEVFFGGDLLCYHNLQLSGAAMVRWWSAYIHPRLVWGQVCGSWNRHRWEVWRTGQAGVFRKKLN